jgi:L-alanine-DL-glutamate epimerase-like enolase superfamily enzyme
LSFHELRGDVLAERIETVDGMMTTPEGPGLGVEISRAKIERYLAT